MNSSPWAKFTTSMMPKISVSPEAISARIMPVTMPFTRLDQDLIAGNGLKNAMIAPCSHSQILVDDRVVRP